MLFHPDDKNLYPPQIMEMAKDPAHFGRMNDPTASSFIKGPCGDEMEFYLVVKDSIIKEIRFYTEGCIATRVCGSVTANLALGRNIDDALGISPKQVSSLLNGLPRDHCHCSILAVSTLYKAIADYLLKK